MHKPHPSVCCWIGCKLQTVVFAAESIANDSLDIMRGLLRIESVTSRQVLDNACVHSFDVEKLYPSIDPFRAIGAIRYALTDFFTSFPTPFWGLLVEAASDLNLYMFEAQVVSFKSLTLVPLHVRSIIDTSYFVQSSGIATGLSCATQIANNCMLSFD